MESCRQISVEETKKLIDEDSATIIDIRDPEAFKVGHIKKALHVTQENVESFLQTSDKEKALICYCYRGFSSQDVAEYFRQKGFKDVCSMEGGFEQWCTVYPYVSAE